MKYFKNISFYIVLFVMLLAFLVIVQSRPVEKEQKYSQLISDIHNGKVQEIILEDNKATVKYKEEGQRDQFVYIPDVEVFMNEINDLIREGELEFRSKVPYSPPWWISILPTLVIIVVFVLFWVFFLQQSQGGGSRVMSFGKSRAKMTIDDKRKVTFNDVAGADEEKEELREIVEFLKNSKKFLELGARIPKGVLLVGPPGTGKTLLAKAVSGEAGVPFFSISGSDFVEMFVGVGASRVRDLFEQAKKNAPCIVFIDEIDAVGRHRGAGLGGGHDEREQTLNQLLVEMDGFGANEGVIILAATNRPDILDPALLRPGRFDRRVVVGLPDIKGREEILKVHAKGKPLAEDVKLDELAKSTPGFTGADLENLLNEAALLAARANKKVITMAEIKEATFKVVMGPEKKSRVMSEKEKRLTAYHEAGHAIAIKEVSTTDRVDRISIIPSGMAGGFTAHKPDEDKNYETKSHLIEKIIVALGGRAAEEIVLGEVSTGAYSDLKQANGIARSMITKYGMSDTLGNLVFANESDEVFIGRDFVQTKNYSEEIAAQIDREVKKIIDSCYERIKNILKENINKLHAVANALMEKEKLEGYEFEELYANA
ncbi:MAG TPA: ATP-dependent metallopeptidase FtsH/Yme1/Tma family protein [Hungateiclostridium thermocellum]|uniref:ATP-dependent zinc metalloprotease FtsH n=2 Tax=Acetivibrio thermocellus TaxID=1515 RepID=A3DHM6_ACET2|nr:ATP-dependent zinc metalloprotease FtsH [Acetivibrio thermocellus]CDG36767.1 ATP-dependent zinc metalloprotease FtsH [Acetivibrio thermocellus BC1]ABN53455.1 ATP-dependent metalloprotease FtsH [Acetivibrio thermocellus ATCC 27405]ADU75906.1 ATP-dependent metalloprotease FtsH [Acetivibrio thermocellus DSM 1313]ALX09938.1 peptidase M41 FtsH domain protein [Acetivibrio thermocellus AD2]ANV77712.1 peptidase M41 FtsH domain protein [Acetivibrio thermocellus DSM 2360]